MIDLKGISKTYRSRNPDYEPWKNRAIPKYRPVKALDDIHLEVDKGEILGVIGPNGAGKTTLIKIIAGLLQPDAGEGHIGGYDLYKERKKVRTSVNISRSGDWVIFDYKLSVLHNLRYWGATLGVPWKDLDATIESTLEKVMLKDKRNEYPENLSAGMRQKLSLARCLLSDRPILLLDEPTANIDPVTANFIRVYTKHGLAGKGKSVVLATHNLWEAEMICDRLLIINDGQMVLEGPTSEIKGLGWEYLVIGVPEVTDDLLDSLRSHKFVEKVAESGKVNEGRRTLHEIRVFGDLKWNLKKIIEDLPSGVQIGKFEVVQPSLNDLFMVLIEEARR